MTLTDSTKTPAKGVLHNHGLTATDATVVSLTGRMTSAEARLTALEHPPTGPVPTLDVPFDGSSVPGLLHAEFQPGDPGYGLDSDFLGHLGQVTVAHGYATITAERKATPSGRPYASASMDTYGSFGQLYGSFESRIRYPKGQGVWPAFWLLPVGQRAPYPEIDVFEAYPAPPGPGGGSGVGTIIQTVHYAGETTSLYTVVVPVPDMTLDWHVHRIEWSPAAIVFKVDGVETSRQTTHIPTVPMYPILTLAMGAPGYRVDATTPSIVRMDIDYLRAWA